ncbi:MAG TPA: alpha/beta family hydrolase [Jiangellaceae bacterium]|nr:alpha/beta family hydrolase [Jiangellaceae bacterium]
MQERLVPTPLGDARLLVSEADTAAAILVLGHGAGGGAHARDLAALARALPPMGVTVIRVEQPWRVAGRRVAPRPPTLDQGWLAALEAVVVEEPLIVGGRSAGARVACRTATLLTAAGVLCCAFPLHLPGRPERSRFEELAGAGVPTLVIQGGRDSFGRPDEFPSGSHQLAVIEHADHSMAVPKGHDQKRALDQVVTAAAAWIGNVLGVQLR